MGRSSQTSEVTPRIMTTGEATMKHDVNTDIPLAMRSSFAAGVRVSLNNVWTFVHKQINKQDTVPSVCLKFGLNAAFIYLIALWSLMAVSIGCTMKFRKIFVHYCPLRVYKTVVIKTEVRDVYIPIFFFSLFLSLSDFNMIAVNVLVFLMHWLGWDSGNWWVIAFDTGLIHFQAPLFSCIVQCFIDFSSITLCITQTIQFKLQLFV